MGATALDPEGPELIDCQPVPCWLPWHHRWSKWAPYRQNWMQTGTPGNEGLRIDEREKRTCSRCGATQDRRIVLRVLY